MIKKKVVFIIPNLYGIGGIERVTITIANELAKLGEYEISILSLCHSNDVIRYPVSSKVNIRNLSLDQFSIHRDFIKAARELRKIFPPEFEGTFVVDDVGHTIPAYLGLKKCKRAKFICWSHMNYNFGHKLGFSGLGKLLAIKKFDYLIALTKEEKEYYDKWAKKNNVIQIYNPRDASIVRKKYNRDSKKIISCGRLDKIKGFDRLIEVAAQVFSKIEDWEWDIYGEGPEREHLLELVREYNLVEKVHFQGFRKDILDIYENYAFNVFTSKSEGCPMAMIEALSAGLPVVSFDFSCGPRDLITDGLNGYIVSDNNISMMSEKIVELINNSEMREEFAYHTEQNLKELDLEYVIQQWKKIL